MKPKKQLINLSYVIDQDTIAYPGDPEVRFKAHKAIPMDGVNVLEVTFGSHTATHLDAPSHIMEKGKTLTDLNLTSFFGVARCLRLKKYSLSIGPEICDSGIKPGEAVFIDTGHGRLWNTPEFYGDRPCLAKEALNILIHKKISALGMDTPGVDMKGTGDKYNHRALLKSDINVYESMANLDRLPENAPFVYFSSPLFIKGADGAPAGILALIGYDDLINSILSFKRGVLEA